MDDIYKIKFLNVITAVIIFVVMIALIIGFFGVSGPFDIILFLIFVIGATWPHVITFNNIRVRRSKLSQKILFVSQVLYLLWFIFVYVESVTVNDALAPLGIAFMGIYSVPVMFIFWGFSWRCDIGSE